MVPFKLETVSCIERQAIQGKNVVPIPDAYFANHSSKPRLSGMDEYRRLYDESVNNPQSFWARTARNTLSFSKDFTAALQGDFLKGECVWFPHGELNASYNCIDRHAMKTPDKVAIIFTGDEPGDTRQITYRQLLIKVCQVASVLRGRGVQKGDVVTLYLPMIPEALISMLACARIGAIHSVIFAGFSSESIRDRILDSGSRVVITANESRRGGRKIPLKDTVDRAVYACPCVESVLVLERIRTSTRTPWDPKRDIWWHDTVDVAATYLDPVPVRSEDPLFILYTSGSTGKPKGLVHSTAGFLVGAAATVTYVMDLHPEDVFFCAGDVGWITGHTYAVYAPLLLGSTTVIFEGTPVYPDTDRLWNINRKYNVTHFYTAPTVLRLLRQKMPHGPPKMAHLRLLGSVGEPIAADVWQWYWDTIGHSDAYVTDTYWQTETGSHIIAPMAGVTPMKPGSASLPMFGILPVILDPATGQVILEPDVEGALAIVHPWPSLARTIYGAPDRYIETYFGTYKGYYFTGDSAVRDRDGYIWIKGRMDDVVNVSGHRLSTAEVEAAVIKHASVAEAAAVGIPDDLTGQAIHVFVTPNTRLQDGRHQALCVELVHQIRGTIGAFAAPKKVHIVEGLPKTRSGKIMRRVLRKILLGEEKDLGDTSTLADPGVVELVVRAVRQG
ncbi:hypothetical protein ANO11243_085010 [Dothideomycetidae sp. 11243]|nr:hypothetical protein ANO11243_085010 [fungal sp. No.11243]